MNSLADLSCHIDYVFSWHRSNFRSSIFSASTWNLAVTLLSCSGRAKSPARKGKAKWDGSVNNL